MTAHTLLHQPRLDKHSITTLTEQQPAHLRVDFLVFLADWAHPLKEYSLPRNQLWDGWELFFFRNARVRRLQNWVNFERFIDFAGDGKVSI